MPRDILSNFENNPPGKLRDLRLNRQRQRQRQRRRTTTHDNRLSDLRSVNLKTSIWTPPTHPPIPSIHLHTNASSHNKFGHHQYFHNIVLLLLDRKWLLRKKSLNNQTSNKHLQAQTQIYLNLSINASFYPDIGVFKFTPI